MTPRYRHSYSSGFGCSGVLASGVSGKMPARRISSSASATICLMCSRASGGIFSTIVLNFFALLLLLCSMTS